MHKFLKISTKSHYGLQLIVYLTEFYNKKNFISLTEVAEREKLSRGYLEEIIRPLKKAGLVDGQRGRSGGYKLKKSPRSISVAQVIEAIEGPVVLIKCLDRNNNCVLSDKCLSKNIWANLQNNILKSLTKTSLANLVSK